MIKNKQKVDHLTYKCIRLVKYILHYYTALKYRISQECCEAYNTDITIPLLQIIWESIRQEQTRV